MAEKTKRSQKKLLWVVGFCVILAAAALWFWHSPETTTSSPVLTVETPTKLSLSSNEEIELDVTVSALGEAYYPAMSMSISFDPSRLEFLGIGEGNLSVHSDSSSSGRQLPEWSCNVKNSNDSGMINVMYLDMTGGKYAFSKELLAEEDNVVLRLRFHLRGSCKAGDVLDITLEDAVFAASDETESLAVTTGTLKIKNGRLVIGE